MAEYFEAPTDYIGGGPSLFLAGGITNCPDWQAEMRGLLAGFDVTILNPRRRDFDVGNPDAAGAQIAWEFHHLRKASAILFWFPRETLCPIVLYELGAWSMTDKPIFVGVHPGYVRRQDVVLQTRLARPDVEIVDNLEAIAEQVISDRVPVKGDFAPCRICGAQRGIPCDRLVHGEEEGDG